jgi:hypothetical protein
MSRRGPGDRLRALALRVCSDVAMERLIDPVLADLQREDADAARRGQVWRRRRLRIAGTLAFWQVIGLHTVTRAPMLAREWAAADEHAVGRTVAFSATFIAALTLLFVWVPLSSTVIERDNLGYYAKFNGHDLAWLVLYIVPQAVAVGVPLGFPCGVLFGLRRRTPTARARRNILLIATACSALMFVVVAWMMPESNQAFRELHVGHRIPRGLHELTLGGLRARAEWFDFHFRLALACATAVLAWFACRVMTVRRSIVLGLAGVIVYCWAFLTVQFYHDALPAVLAAWLPNLILAAVTAGLKPSRRLA